jgi:FlaA1/EpsC-like NDP-sugar epimerase
MVITRSLRSWQVRHQAQVHSNPVALKRILLIGAGRAGAQIVQETHQNTDLNFQVVGFLDDDVTKLDRQVEGVKVLGPVGQVVAWATYLQVDEILITMPSAPGDRIQQIMTLAKGEGLNIRILPRMQELFLDRNLTGQIREVRLEDFLRRPEVCLDFGQVLTEAFPSAQAQIENQIVLVTGAGGTIGSELCRQAARLHPRQLILLGRGENSIFHIDQELRQTFPQLDLVPIIADIRNLVRMEQIFATYHPKVVFHAAAHKHVPLMEQNPMEAIENNTLASAQLALLADQHHVKTFVLISTDKAVDPLNFMGMSKRLAELIVSTIGITSQTRFLAVRFGNVLGSRGSVVPIFQQQIAQGGPVTITDPAMTRYFMTTPEAAQLVIQSLAVGESGQILLLNMGQPIKIQDLAEQMIRLAGHIPNEGIKIQVTGMRPGEKLHESLVSTVEQVQPTAHPDIMAVYSAKRTPPACEKVLAELYGILGTSIEYKKLWSFTKQAACLLENGEPWEGELKSLEV